MNLVAIFSVEKYYNSAPSLRHHHHRSYGNVCIAGDTMEFGLGREDICNFLSRWHCRVLLSLSI